MGDIYQDMKSILFFLLLTIFSFTLTEKVSAEEKMVFDSVNNYLGACDLTDSSQWTLDRDYNVTKFEIWYKWEQGETSLPVTINYKGSEFAKFEATRGSCDPYQASWCNADYQINKTFPKGDYTTNIPNKRQCLKPGVTGAVRIYENGSDTVRTPATPVPSDTKTNDTQVPNLISQNQTDNKSVCACTKTIVITSVITSFITSFVALFVARKLIK